MKSCIQWRKSFKYLPQIDEFNIQFKRKDTKLLKFLDKYAKSQRVNIYVNQPDITEDDINLLIEIYKTKKYNIAVVCQFGLNDSHQFSKLRFSNVPFYFCNPVETWDVLLGFIAIGVSDVFVTNDLGFDLEEVSKVTKPLDIQIRCYANICQSSWNEGFGFKSFYIRPEDVDKYSEFVDVLEFYKSEERQSVLYDIYFHDKKWSGELREIIQGLKLDVNNHYIIDDQFADRRIRCKKKCIKGGRCRLCDRLLEFAISLENSPEYQVFNKRKGDN